jgi:hypothetical protein
MKELKVKITFTEEILGTACNDPNVHGEYIASKAPDRKTMEEEIEAVGVDEIVEKAMTVFPRTENGEPFVYDYQIKGFLKDGTGVLRKVKGTVASKVKAYKKEIDGLVFPAPRKIIIDTQGRPLGNCQRPLRAQTMQGERVALSNSETAPEGSTIEFSIMCMTDDMYNLVVECLDYGKYRGLGQWRNSGKGRFDWQEIK